MLECPQSMFAVFGFGVFLVAATEIAYKLHGPILQHEPHAPNGDTLETLENLSPGATNLEIFRIREKNIPVDIVEVHRCPFPIGWLIKKEGLEGLPL